MNPNRNLKDTTSDPNCYMDSRLCFNYKRQSRLYIPAPSLHIGVMRNDAWNEFLEHGRTTEKDLLNFNSSEENSNDQLRQQVRDQLTVIAGVAPALSQASLIPDSLLPEIPIEIPSMVSFLFQQPAAVVPDRVLEGLTDRKPAVGAGLPERVSESVHELTEPVEETNKSVWGRMQSAWSNLTSVQAYGLPSWFSNEQALVVPADAEVRAVLGSIYGGVKSRVIVSVRVIEAVDVPALDFWGSSDPYVSACIVRGVGGLSAGRLDLLPTIGSVKSCTPKFATLNPKWSETVQLDPADLLSVISDSVLHLSMWDKDIVKSDDPVGFTTISLIDSLQASGVSPHPILPIQITGSLIGPHAGVFCKIQLRMVQKVGCLSVTPVALQGFTRGWKNYAIRLEVKITDSDPIASQTYVSAGLCQPEQTPPATVNDTGHAVWPKTTSPVTVLFSAPKKAKPYLHITLKTDGVSGDAGQIAIRIGMLERMHGVSALKLSPLDGSPKDDVLRKCSLYCGVECELVD